MTLRIQVRPLRGSPLVEGYLRGEQPAASFFEGRPFELESFRRKRAEVRARFDRPARERAAAALHPTSPAAAARLRRFVDEGGAMVTTGQQAGLFTGPLYTIHKALSAVRLAAALEEELGTLVLPVFWIASEDHDFAEAGQAHATGPDGALHRFAVAPTDARPLAMSEMRLGRDVETTLDRFAHVAFPQGDASGCLTLLRDAYRRGETVAGAFLRTVMELFAGLDLLVADAADPALKAASAPVLLGELEGAAEHEAAVEARSERLAEAGFAPQVRVMPGATDLFHHGAAGRERLLRDGRGFVARESRRRFAPGEAEAELRADPTRFSPNVFLRPVVESALFPTLAYVGGPGETAYFAQVGPLYRSFGILPPVAYPRFSAVLVPAAVEETLRTVGMEMDELRPPLHEVLHSLARSRLPGGVEESLAHLRASVVDAFARVMDAAREVDPNLDPALGAVRNRALLLASDAERKVLSHAKKRDRAAMRAVETARNHLYPEGVPQERLLNVFPYLAMHGPSLLADVLGAMEVRWEREAVVAGE